LFAVVPLCAVICYLAGWIAFGVIWLVVILIGLVAILGLFLGPLFFLYGKGDEQKGGGCLGFIAALVAFYIMQAINVSWPAAADGAVRSCSSTSSYLVTEIFIGERIYLWTWTLLALELALATLLLLTIGLLRCEGIAKYSLMRIGYACPNCHRRELPYFRCSRCSMLIPDLAPSLHGIIQANCANCGQSLATTDLFGRLKLDKVCSRTECSADLNDPSLGRVGEFHLAIVGAASSGKTNLMVSSIWKMETAFARKNGITIGFADSSEQAAYRARVGQLEKGIRLDKTIDVRTFNLTLNRTHGQSCRLYIYDAAGEDFAEEDRLGGHVFHRFVDGIVFLVDPFAEADIRRERAGRFSADDFQKINPAAQDASEILARLVNSLEATLGIRAGGLFPIPMAVTLTKVDALDRGSGPGEPVEVDGSYLTLRLAADHAVERSDQVRRYLIDSGLGNFVGILESRFPRVGYFGVSALGRLPTPEDRSPFRPRGVLAPLVWLCYQTRAFSDAFSIQIVFANAFRILERSLRGHQGTRARVFAWLLVLGAAALLLCGAWYGLGLSSPSNSSPR
jgi:hypothetical protein